MASDLETAFAPPPEGATASASAIDHSAWDTLLRRHVRRVLGHKTIDTTMRFYVAFETEAVAARFDEGVLKERKATLDVAAQHFGKAMGGGSKDGGGDKSKPGPRPSKPEKKP